MIRSLLGGLCALALSLPAGAGPLLRPSPLPSDLPTLHFILAPAAHPASIAAAARTTLPAFTPSLPKPVIVFLTPAPALQAFAAPAPLELRLPVRAALEQVGAALAVAPQGGIAAERSLGTLFEAGRKDSVETPFVVVRRAADAALLDAAMAEARKSATGRRVLKRAETARDGRPVPLQVRDLGGNLGEYDYMAGVLRLDRALLESDLKRARELLAEEVDDLENAPRVSAQRLFWARRDLALLKSRKGRAAYRAFADRVLRLIKENHRKV